MTVLLVEDTVGAAIKRVLEKLGFAVLLATDGESAWEMLDEAEIDLFLIDWMLPGSSGIDLVRKIRGMPRYEDAPIVMISGRAGKRDIVEAIEAGITTYIAKPFSVAQLRDKVEDVLGRSDAALTQRLLRVCRNQDELLSRSEHALVLFAEASNTYAELIKPHMRSTAEYLVRFVENLSENGAAETEVGYRIEKHTNDIIEYLKRQHRRNRIKLVMASIDSGGNSYLLMRLLTVNRHGRIPVVLTCDDRSEIPSSQLPLIEELEVEICTRKELDGPTIREIMERHVLEGSAAAVPDSPAAARRRIQADLRVADGLPPMPAVFEKVRRLAADPDSDIRDWARAIRADPVLGATTLRHARAPAYGFQEEIVDIERAVVLLGKSHMEQLVAAASLKRAFERGRDSSFHAEAFWLHSIAVAFAAHLLSLPPHREDRSNLQEQEFAAMHLSQEEVEVLQRIDLPRRLRLDDPALPFTAGLLHDVGKVTMAHAYPGLFPLILSELEGKKWREPMLAAEAAVAGGFTHVEVGEILARKWHLGNRLVSAITHHHDPVAGEPCSFLVGIADLCAHAVHTFPDNAGFPMTVSDADDDELAPIDPFLPAGFSDQQYVSSVDLDQLWVIVGPVARRLTARMQSSLAG